MDGEAGINRYRASIERIVSKKQPPFPFLARARGFAEWVSPRLKRTMPALGKLVSANGKSSQFLFQCGHRNGERMLLIRRGTSFHWRVTVSPQVPHVISEQPPLRSLPHLIPSRKPRNTQLPLSLRIDRPPQHFQARTRYAQPELSRLLSCLASAAQFDFASERLAVDSHPGQLRYKTCPLFTST